MSIKWNELTINQWRPVLQCLMITNENNLKKCILKIYEFQTQEEKNENKTQEENGLGFNKVDADVMSEIAKKILKREDLTKGELAKAKNKMPKYWRQIMYVCKENLKNNHISVKEKENKQSAQMTFDYEHQDEVIEARQEETRKCQEESIPCNYGICSDCSH